MMHKASEIEVYRADHSILIVANEGLFVDKSGAVFIDPYPRINKIGVSAFCKHLNYLFIRNSGSYYNYLHASASGISECLSQIVVDYKIRRRYIDVPFRLVYQIDKYVFADRALK